MDTVNAILGLTPVPSPVRPRPAAGPRTSWRRTAIDALAVLAVVSREMSFLDHLEELRRRLIWSAACVAVVFAGCWFFAADLYDIASAPLRANPEAQLIVTRVQDVFSLQVKVTMVAALFLSSPFLLAQAWLFISPGLYAHERRLAIPIVAGATLLFVLGGAFGYFLAFPVALQFLIDWALELHLTPNIDASEYFSLFFQVIVALGVVFQIPVVIFVLSRMGLVTARFLIRHFKYALFGSVLIASIITPTPDFANMLIIAGPMLTLYIIGIGVAFVVGGRGRQRRESGEA
jgi:sec-independent protein translocase protein TatC